MWLGAFFFFWISFNWRPTCFLNVGVLCFTMIPLNVAFVSELPSSTFRTSIIYMFFLNTSKLLLSAVRVFFNFLLLSGGFQYSLWTHRLCIQQLLLCWCELPVSFSLHKFSCQYDFRIWHFCFCFSNFSFMFSYSLALSGTQFLCFIF